jgi:pyruvate formate lyase activating enzyme
MIKGWMRTTLLDYPGQIASIVFLGGRCFHCPICHNSKLVLHPHILPDIPVETILEHLRQRKGKITGLVISGGEPCLSQGLTDFLRKVRTLGIHIKLDTCGYLPDVLKGLLHEQLVDMIAMDIKAPPAKYANLAGLEQVDIDRINASIALIRNSGLQYEFRTTVVSDWITPEDIAEIASWLSGAQRYVLQQFRAEDCLDPSFNKKSPYPSQMLHQMQSIAGKKIRDVVLRGI